MLILLSVLGAAITVGTSIVQWQEKKNAEKKAEESKQIADQKQKDLEEANKAIINLQKQTIDSVNTIADLNKKLLEENELVKDLQHKLLMEQTSGGSRPEVSPFLDATNKNTIGIYIANNSDYAITDIKLRLSDLEWMKDIAKMTAEDRGIANNNSNTDLNIGTMSKHSAVMPAFVRKVEPNISIVKYRYNLSWKHGIYQGLIVFERENGNGGFRVKSFTKEI